MKAQGEFFSAEELNGLRAEFFYVDADAHGRKRLFFDNAGGSLRLKAAVERFREIDAMPDASEHLNEVALELLTLENQGRADMRLLFDAKKGAIATGYTASQLMMDALSVISANVTGTNVVTTCLEHPSSFDAMKIYADKHHRELRVANANKETGGVEAEAVLALVDENTAIVSVMAASNISGHIMDVEKIAREARKIRPDIIVISDAVQHAPHGALCPEKWDVDVMNIAPYKFFGSRGFALMYLSDRVASFPHHSLIGKAEDRWEIGSPGTAQIVAFSEIVNYVCRIGAAALPKEENRRKLFERGMERIADHERALLHLALTGTEQVKGLRHIPGVTVKMDDKDLIWRDFIIGIEFSNMDSVSARKALEARGVVGFERLASSMYSRRMMEQFDSEGVVRLSPLHVNTPEEILEFLRVVAEVAAL